jgi:predicted ester cyclase
MSETGPLSAIVEALIDAYNTQDFARLRGFFVDDLHFCHHNRGFTLDNADEFVSLLEHFAREIVPDRRFGPRVRILESGDTVVREQSWGGLVQQGIPGMAQAGDHLQLDLCSVFIFSGDKVAEYHDYG